MNPIVNYLHKSILKHFFSQHAFFILLIILFAGGFMSGREHQQIALLAIQNPIVMMYYMLFWLAVALYTLYFLYDTLSAKGFRSLYQLVLIPKIRTLAYLAYICFVANILSVLYAGFIISKAIQMGNFKLIGSFLVFFTLIFVAGSVLLYYRLQQPFEASHDRKPVFDLPKSINFIFIFHLLTNNVVVFAIVKILSFGLIKLFFYLNTADTYDYRFFTFAMIMSGFLQYPIIEKWIQFEARHLMFMRALPIPALRRWVMSLLIAFLFTLPELVFFAYKYQGLGSAFTILSWGLALIAFAVFLKSYFYYPIHEQKLQLYLVWGFVGALILCLYGLSPLYWALILLSASFFLHLRFFYKWEPRDDIFTREKS